MKLWPKAETVQLGLLLTVAACASSAEPSELRRLASGVTAGVPSWNREATTLVIDSETPPGLVAIDVATGTETRLSTNPLHNAPSFSPADDALVYADKDAGGIWIRNTDGNSRPIEAGDAELPDHPWSPDGTWLVFLDDRGLVVWNRRTGEDRVLVPGPEQRRKLGVLGWSLDGSLLFGYLRGTIVAIDFQTGNLHQIEEFPADSIATGPGEVLWGRSRADGNDLLRKKQSAGVREVRLPGAIRAIDVHPRTGKVIVSVARTGVALVNPDTLDFTWLSRDHDPLQVSWAPDGQHFAAVIADGGSAALYVGAIP